MQNELNGQQPQPEVLSLENLIRWEVRLDPNSSDITELYYDIDSEQIYHQPDTSGQNFGEDHASAKGIGTKGLIAINGNSQSDIHQFVWEATEGLRRQAHEEAGVAFNEESLVDGPVIEQDPRQASQVVPPINTPQTPQQPMQQHVVAANMMQVPVEDLMLYRELNSMYAMVVNSLVVLLESKLEPDAPEHNLIATWTSELNQVRGIPE